MSDHHHLHHPTSPSSQDAKENIAIAFTLNAVFTIIEIVGGILTNSIAIISDAVHDLGDTISLGLAWYSEKLAQRKPDSRYTYGYKRFPVLAALINAAFLLAASVFVLTQAIPMLLKPSQVNETGMIVLALLGIIFNGAAVLRLKGGQSLNQRVVRLHLMEDTLGWIAVLAGALIMKYTGLKWIDAALAIGIALYIIFNALRNLRDALRIFLQATPEKANGNEIAAAILEINGIEGIHDVRTWTIDGMIHVYTLHIVTKSDIKAEQFPEIKQQVRRFLSEKGFEFVTIEIDTHDEHCQLNNC
ncbi:MAG: cation transporter [Lentimicrobiaceae bacterium]|nr:cation transporter [Lentimicrobiaceae bacterium]MCB9024348.1 cation transporter [Lentimicrobiaceae bacterium]MCO5264687.1 cation diffusion facilitator family transporter [Lentimicrobium sp.]HPG32587.1 cation diffusion facilitator family transporter [Lentimicrobium sp.]